MLKLARPGMLLLAWGISWGVAPAQTPPTHPAPKSAGMGYARAPRYAGSLSAAQAVELALSHSFEISVQGARTALDGSDVKAAEAQGRPRVSIGTFLAQGNQPMIWSGAAAVDPAFWARIDNPGALDAYAMLMVPLFTGGQLEARLEAAKQGERAAVARLALSLRTAARDTRLAYTQVQLEQARLETLKWERDQREEVVRLVKAQLRQGRVARVALLRAQAERDKTLQETWRKQADLVTAEAKLKTTMGVAVDSSFSYPPETRAPVEVGSLDDNLRTALSDRCDLVAGRYAVAQGDALVVEALAEYSPRGTFVTMLEAMRPFSTPAITAGYQVGLVISWSIYDGGMRRAQEDRARANSEVLKRELSRMELNATGEVVAARARLDAAQANLGLTDSQRRKSDEELRISKLRFELGRGLMLEVLDSLSLAARARNDQAAARYDWESAYAELLFTTGRY